MEAIPLQDLDNVDTCCISDQRAMTLDPVHGADYKCKREVQGTSAVDATNQHQPAPRRERLASRMPAELRRSSKDLLEFVTKDLTEKDGVSEGAVECISASDTVKLVAANFFVKNGIEEGYEGLNESSTTQSSLNNKDERCAIKHNITNKNNCDNSDFSRQDSTNSTFGFGTGFTSASEAAQEVEAEYLEFSAANLILDDKDEYHDNMLRSGSTVNSHEDSLALEVGRSAHDYLEECFYTEVKVLNRGKFNAIPDVIKSDFEITVG